MATWITAIIKYTIALKLCDILAVILRGGRAFFIMGDMGAISVLSNNERSGIAEVLAVDAFC